MGILNVTPDSFSDGGEWFDARRGGRARPRARRRRARPSSTSAASRRAPAPSPVPVDEELAPRRARRRRAGRRRRRAGLGRHVEGRGRGARRSTPARRTSTTSPRCATTRGWPALVADRRLRRAASCTCSASRARCSATRATATSSTRSGPSWPSASSTRVAAGVDPDRIQVDPGHRLRQDARAQPRAARAASTRSPALGLPGRPGRLAQVVPRAAHGPRGPPRARRRRRSPPTSSASSAGRASSASTTSRRRAMRSRWRLLRFAAHDGRPRRRARRRVDFDDDDDEEDGPQTEVTVEVTRPLALHAPRRHATAEREVGQRLVLDLRLEVGRVPTRRSPTSSRTPSTTAAVCERVALVAQQRSYRTLERLCSADRRPPARRLRRRGGLGQGDQARAADPAARRGGLGRGVAPAPGLS